MEREQKDEVALCARRLGQGGGDLGQRIQKNSKVHPRNNRVQSTNHQTSRDHQKSEKEKCRTVPKNLGNILAKTVKRFGLSLSDWFKELPDHRNKTKSIYSPSHFMWGGILMFMLHLGSRKQYREERKPLTFLKNLLKLSRTKENTNADPDTICDFLKALPYQELDSIPARLVSELIRKKSLDYSRLFGHFTVALDGTGTKSYPERHCKYCLTKTSKKTGKTLYYHLVLEAKLVTPNGLALSVGREFIENPHEFPTKQDCEYNAFKRLSPRIKEYFPRMPFCFLLDGLFCNGPIFEICEKNNWKYIITFKSGSLPTFYEETFRKKQKKLENRKNVETSQKNQTFAWVGDLTYQSFSLNAIFCHEVTKKKVVDFSWLTNFEVNYGNVATLANKGGRLRWKIENEGFNAQKKGGYEMEHPYSKNENAAKCYFIILQIAHILNQLIVKGSLFLDFKKQMGSIKNYARRLAEHLRNILIDDFSFSDNLFQIRLNTS